MMTMLELSAMMALKPFAEFFKSSDHDLSINDDGVIVASFNDSKTGMALADISIEDLRKAYKAFIDLRVLAENATENESGIAHNTLREANIARQAEWDTDDQITLAFRGNEMAGEVGEALEAALSRILSLGQLVGLASASGRASNIIKKLERERMGIKGSRATLDELAQELADIVICADLVAMSAGIELMEQAVPDKFNATSEKVGLMTRLRKAVPNV